MGKIRIDLKEILNQIPDYKEFLTIAELDASSIRLADQFELVDLKEIGKSREGRTIYCLKIGKGKENTLLFAFPHPNEPIGSMTLEFLSQFLAENPEFTKETGYTWYLIKAIDIDSAILNEGWFKGEFSPIKYAKNFYRPAGHEQIEWSFPIKYKKLTFDNPPPETQALMSLILEIKPKFMNSLHNSGFGGVYFYVTSEIGNLFGDLTNFVRNEKLPLHLGEPEAPYINKLHDAIFQNFGVQKMYDFAVANGVENPEEFIKVGNTSFDYLRSITGDRSFTLVCEIPYFYHNSIEDISLTKLERRDLLIKSLEYKKSIYRHSRKMFNHIRKFSDKSTRLYTAVTDYMRLARPEFDLAMNDVKTSPSYSGKATVSQAFDSNVATRFYTLLRISMITRLYDEALTSHPDNKDELVKIKKDFEQWIEQKINEILSGITYEVIPIQKLVRVQVGSAFITLKNLS
ncbi:MAG: M14 family zinc carboxypeptidase [Promethearchaeota archaeon]